MGGVIVGVDDSKTARRAARRAATVAAALDEPLHIVTAVKRGGPGAVKLSTDEFVDDPVSRSRQLLQSIKVELNVPEAETKLGDKDPAKAICDEAERIGAALIVVGNRRVQGASRVLGTVAADVLRHATCDVLVAHTAMEPSDG